MDKLIAIALSIQAIHASVKPGMILAPLRGLVSRLLRRLLRLRRFSVVAPDPGYFEDEEEYYEALERWGNDIELKAERLACWIEKPLYECTTCMGGIWTLILYAIFYGLDPGVFIVMLEVIGLNALIANITQHEN